MQWQWFRGARLSLCVPASGCRAAAVYFAVFLSPLLWGESGASGDLWRVWEERCGSRSGPKSSNKRRL